MTDARKPLPLLWQVILFGLGLACILAGDSVLGVALAFPRRARLKAPVPALSEPFPRQSRRLLFIVVDGLNLEGLKAMPFTRSLAEQGASFIARTAQPSYSRTGYTQLGTGAPPEVSGISSNEAKHACDLDSIFLRARAQNMKTGFVGYAWWLSIFPNQFHWFSCDSAWDLNDPWFRSQQTLSLLNLGHECRVHNSLGQYQKITGHWETFIRQEKLPDLFGNLIETQWNEEQRRGDEALRILKTHKPDLLLVHFQNPDAWGHYTASAQSDRYFEGCKDADDNIQRLVAAIDRKHDTLCLTSDHGFVSTVENAGHGGWEAATINVPLIFWGHGIKTSKGQSRVRQIDIAPTLAALLGTDLPHDALGRPLLEALNLSDSEKSRVQARSRTLRHKLLKELWPRQQLPDSAPQSEPEWQRFEARLWQAVNKQIVTTQALRAVLVTLMLALLLFALKDSLPPWSVLLSAIVIYEGIFHALHFLWLGVYSMSVVSSAGNIIQRLLLLNAVAWFLTLALIRLRSHDLRAVTLAIGLGALSKSAIIFSAIGTVPSPIIPHGFWIYAAICGHLQSLFTLTMALPLVSFFGWIAARRSIDAEAADANGVDVTASG